MCLAGEGVGGNEEEDAVSPRTLRQAAEQLAKYTTAEEGGAPSDQWSDFFRYPTKHPPIPLRICFTTHPSDTGI